MFLLGRKEMDVFTPLGRGGLSMAGRGAQRKHQVGFSQPHERRGSTDTQLGEV